MLQVFDFLPIGGNEIPPRINVPAPPKATLSTTVPAKLAPETMPTVAPNRGTSLNHTPN